MKKLRKFTHLLPLIFISCFTAPKAIFIIEPAKDTGVWLMGKQYFHSKSGDLEIALAFDKMRYYEYQFLVEITNSGDETILVAPENFYLVAHNYFNSIDIVLHDTIYALDPEQQIHQTYMNESTEYAAYQTVRNTQTLFSFLDLVQDIAEIDEPKTDAEILEDENEYLQSEIDELESELEHEREIKSINDQFFKWESKALRKTTLPKEYLIRGSIFFPLIEKADALDIHFTLHDTDLVFKYNQYKEKVH